MVRTESANAVREADIVLDVGGGARWTTVLTGGISGNELRR